MKDFNNICNLLSLSILLINSLFIIFLGKEFLNFLSNNKTFSLFILISYPGFISLLTTLSSEVIFDFSSLSLLSINSLFLSLKNFRV